MPEQIQLPTDTDLTHHLTFVPVPEDGKEDRFAELDIPNSDKMCEAFWERVSVCAIGAKTGIKHGTLYVVAHNVGYDQIATGSYVHLPAHRCHNVDGSESCKGWIMEAPYSKGPVYIQRARHGSTSLCILSSTNYFTAKLKQVAKDLGVPDKIEYEQKKFYKKRLTPAEWVELEEYCRRDVEIVRRAMLWLCAMLRKGLGPMPNGQPDRPLGPFRMTISSIAFSAWRYRFMPYPVTVHTNTEATQIERDGYCGGRTEADFIGTLNGEIFCFDVNNLYGSVMAFNRLPCKLVNVIPAKDAPSPETLKEWVTDPDHPFVYIAHVYVNMREPAVPLKADKLLFKTGTFETTLCGPELRLAFAYGEVLSVGAVAVYDAQPIFKHFCDVMSAKRVDAEGPPRREAERRLYKDCNNHVYGKLGQQSEEWRRIGDLPVGETCRRDVAKLPDVNGKKGKRIIRLFTPMGVYESNGEPEESYHSFPAIAAYITSAARARLWTYMRLVKAKGAHHLFYRDTDSIMVDRIGRDALEAAGVIHESELGKLKLEWRAIQMVIGGAKWYSFLAPHEQHEKGKASIAGYVCESGYLLDDKGKIITGIPTTEPHLALVEKHKGIGKDHKLIETKDGPKYAGEQWPGFAGHINFGDVGHFHNVPIRKKSTVDYGKGMVGPDGWVVPFHSTKLPTEKSVAIPVFGV